MNSNKDLKEEIIKYVQANHMWLNAFLILNPSDDLKIKIGNWVIECLKKKDDLLPTLFDGDNDKVTEIQKLTPVFYCSFNAS